MRSEMAGQQFLSRRKRKRSQEDIRQYMTVTPSKILAKNSKKTKKKLLCESDTNASSYVPASSLSTGIRRKQHQLIRGGEDKVLLFPAEHYSNNNNDNSSIPITSVSPDHAPSPSQSRDNHVKSSLNCSTESSPLMMTDSDQLSEESLLALLNYNTEQFLAEI